MARSSDYSSSYRNKHRADAVEEQTHEYTDVEKFAAELTKDNPDPKVLDDYVHGPDAADRLSQESWQKVQDYINREEKLTTNEMYDFVHEMHRQASTAYFQLRDWEKDKGLDEETYNLIHTPMWNHMVEKSQHHPISPIEHQDPYIEEAWNKVWDKRINNIIEHPGRWDEMESHLSVRQEEINNFQTNGNLPDWLKPEWYTEERMTLTPENKALGYNPVHNQPIDILDKPENNEPYLRERMDTHLLHYTRTNGGVQAAEFAKALIEPYLDPDLSKNFSYFDPDNWYYTDDGPINYQENVESAVLGDTTDPSCHAETTYCRLVRECLMEKGLAHDAEIDRADLLAMSLPRSVMALERAAEFGKSLTDRTTDGTNDRTMDPQSERYPLEGHEPIVTWNAGDAKNLEAVLEATNDFTSTAPFRYSVVDTIKNIQETFNPSDAVNPDSWTQNYSFMPKLPDVADTDVDHPGRFMLREALTDLSQAVALADQADLPQAKEEALEASRNGELQEKLAQFAEDYRSGEFIDQVRYFAENHPDNVEKKYLERGMDARQAKFMASMDHMTRNMLREEEAYRQPDRTDLAQRAMNRVTHADFNIQAILLNTDITRH